MKFAFSCNGHKLVFGDSDLALDTDNEKFKFFSLHPTTQKFKWLRFRKNMAIVTFVGPRFLARSSLARSFRAEGARME